MSRATIEDIVGNVLAENYIIDINIKKNEKKINIIINDPMQIEIIEAILNQLNGTMYLKIDENTKISLKNYLYRTEYDDDNINRYISVIPQFMYIGKEYVVDNITNIKAITICFGNSKVVDLDFRISRILNWNFSSKFKNNDIVFKKNIFEIKFKKYTTKLEIQDTFYSFIELLWIFYGFVPNIKFIQYDTQDIVIKEYFKMADIYYTTKEFFLDFNRIIDISKIKDWEKLIKSWNKIREEYKESFLGLMVSQMKNNTYIDMRLCNTLQAIDGFSSKFLAGQNDMKKSKYIDSVIRLLKNNDDYKKNIEEVLTNAKTLSFKERIRKMLEYDKDNLIFYEEKLLEETFRNKENKCKVFLKENKFLNKSINERNRLSHMVKKSELFSQIENKYYYWKYILLYRIVLVSKLNIEYAIDKENYRRNLESMHNWLVENKKCNKCKYLKNEQCELFKKEKEYGKIKHEIKRFS